jgi:hypothetical protein
LARAALPVRVRRVEGGVGKTTLAFQLALARAFAGRDVLLIDADRQGSAQDAVSIRAGAGLRRLPEGPDTAPAARAPRAVGRVHPISTRYRSDARPCTAVATTAIGITTPPRSDPEHGRSNGCRQRWRALRPERESLPVREQARDRQDPQTGPGSKQAPSVPRMRCRCRR